MSAMKITNLVLLVAIISFSCGKKDSNEKVADLDMLATEYVRLALDIGQYDEAFVDAYYGPENLRPGTPRSSVFPKDSLIAEIRTLKASLEHVGKMDDSLSHRAAWLTDQLISFERRIRIFSGEYDLFDVESKDLFATTAPVFNEHHYKMLVDQLDRELPGDGSVQERFQALANHFIIPKDKLDTVFRAAIAECRKRTLAHYLLPEEENFTLEFVSDKSWNGYNWYKGKYQSVIQINTDLNIFIDRAIDVGSHESYPGHHVYNMMLEKNLYRDQGLVEFSIYPLYSPQSLIAEGSANYGIEVVFPGKDKTDFARDILLPLAGLDTTGISLYFEALETKSKLNYVRNDVARGLLSGAMTEEEALRWLETYGLYNHETALKSISFIRNHRSYVINYNYGMDLVSQYINRSGGSNPEDRWRVFEALLSNQIRIVDLLQGNQ